MGGISILGTTGIVEPRSLSALRDSIELEIRQAAALGARDLVVVPGNYGSDYVSGNLRIGAVPVVACSNFMGSAIDCAAREGFERVLVVGHIGKMVKVCGGIMDTHSRVADARMEILAAHAAASGAPAERVRQIMDAATADAGLEILQREGLVVPTCESLSRALSIRLGPPRGQGDVSSRHSIQQRLRRAVSHSRRGCDARRMGGRSWVKGRYTAWAWARGSGARHAQGD